MSVIESQASEKCTTVSEDQAIEMAKAWLANDIGQNLPVIGAFYKPAVEAGGPEGYYFDQPARWLVVFQCDVPEGFHPDHIDLYVDAATGEIEAPPMM